MLNSPPHTKARHYVVLFLKGMAMGAGDVVPGVSGGTIAFISGIYEELIDSLRRIDQRALLVLFKQGPLAAWRHINGFFLLTLFAGILFSVFTLAKLISYTIDHYPIPIWSFFFGLVCASALFIARQIKGWRVQEIACLVIGTGLALLVSVLKPAQLPTDWWMIMFAGSIAICAMILPGISGAFILVLLGFYPLILQAISQLQWGVLALFAVGCVIGLMVFSHLLFWLLQRFHGTTLALLCGFLLGSLKLLWPWKQTIEFYKDSHGQLKPLVQQNLLPGQFEAVLGENAHAMMALIAVLAGVGLVLLLEWLATRSDYKSAKK